MQGLTGLQRDLLFVLGGIGSTNGTRLKRELERSKYSSVLSGRLYYNLDILVDQSLVQKRAGEGRTNEYCLTEQGRESLRDHHEWQRRYLGSASTPSETVPY